MNRNINDLNLFDSEILNKSLTDLCNATNKFMEINSDICPKDELIAIVDKYLIDLTNVLFRRTRLRRNTRKVINHLRK